MKKISTLIGLFFMAFGYAQKKITIYDAATKAPVQYANIWKEKELFVTADSTGSFLLNKSNLDLSFKISAIGYRDTIVKINQDVFIRPEMIGLEEVRIVNRKNQKELKLGKAKRGDTSYGVQYDSKMALCAKYFPNTANEIRFVSTVKFFAGATTNNRMVSISVYNVNDRGEPDEIINTENVLCKFKKGRHIAQVDLSNWNIEFPKKGIFIVIQHLLLEQNKYYDTASNHPNAFFYEPLIAVNYCDEYKDTWYFKDGIWNRNKGFSINMELILTD